MPTVNFEPKSHVYTLNGKRLPSVTQALSVVTNFDRVDPEVLERARIFGHHVHLACHLMLIDDLNERTLDPEIASRLDGFKKFLVEHPFIPTASEEIVCSTALGYAGMLDVRGMWKTSTALLDLKSGVIPTTVGMQTAGYQKACVEPPRKRFCLQLKPYDYRFVALDDPTDYSYFVSCLNVFKLTQRKNPYGEQKEFHEGRRAASPEVSARPASDPGFEYFNQS